jgi:hypothetical protein
MKKKKGKLPNWMANVDNCSGKAENQFPYPAAFALQNLDSEHRNGQ